MRNGGLGLYRAGFNLHLTIFFLGIAMGINYKCFNIK